MSGFNYDAGRSNNMVEAEKRGMVTIGRWAKRWGVSAAAAVEVMSPSEAHHTGTGRVGRSRLTPVIYSATEPGDAQLLAMRAFDAASKAAKDIPPREVPGCTARRLSWPTSRKARRIPTEHLERVTAILYADGTVSCREFVGTSEEKITTGWHKLGGLVIVGPDGAVVFHTDLNVAYETVADIARRITPAGPGRAT